MATRRHKVVAEQAATGDQPTGQSLPVDGMTPDRMPGNAPVLYADQITDIIYGIHTSKLVLSLENGSGAPRPVVTVVIPTAALVVAAGSFLDTMGSERMVSEVTDRLGSMVEMLNRLKAITQRKD